MLLLPASPVRAFARRYIRDMVYAANDGLVTTFAVVAGAQGAELGATPVLVLGFANLAADGLSMAVGNYLGITSERAAESAAHADPGYSGRREALRAVRHAAVTWGTFVVIGLIPLLPFLLSPKAGAAAFRASALLSAATLFVIGALRTCVTGQRAWQAGLEMLFVGTLAGGAAYAAGRVAETLLGRG